MPRANEGPRSVPPPAAEGAAQGQGAPVRGARPAGSPRHLHAASLHDERDGLVDRAPVQGREEDSIGRPARPDIAGHAARERVDVGMPLAQHGAELLLAALVQPPRQGGHLVLGRHAPDGVYVQVPLHRRINEGLGHARIHSHVLYAHGDALAPSLELDHRLSPPLHGILHHACRFDDYRPLHARVCAARVGVVLGRHDHDAVQAPPHHVRRDRKPVLSPGHAGARRRRYLFILPALTRQQECRGTRRGPAGTAADTWQAFLRHASREAVSSPPHAGASAATSHPCHPRRYFRRAPAAGGGGARRPCSPARRRSRAGERARGRGRGHQSARRRPSPKTS